MKRFTINLLFAFLLLQAYAQNPNGINYQAIARNASGSPLSEKSLTIELSIRYGSSSGQILWTEKHVKTTSVAGLFSLVIGVNSERLGGSHSSFDEINWSSGQHYIQVKVDDGNGLVDLGSEPLWSVPYALSAKDVEQPLAKLEVEGGLSDPDTVLFEVRRNDGTPVFGVYNSGVRVFVEEDPVKGVKGGFAVGGYRKSKSMMTQDYLWVTRDSVRVYVPNDYQNKGLKGGFAVGGYSKNSKSHHEVDKYDVDYLMGINRGITRFNTNDSIQGFTIGAQSRGWGSSYMRLTQYNYSIGLDAGLNILPDTGDGGKFNAYFGYQAGEKDVKGHHNLFFGHQAGWNNSGSASLLDGNYNVFIGHRSGAKNIGGYRNVYLGPVSGEQSTSGSGNVFIGFGAGRTNNGRNNIFIGNEVGNGTLADVSNALAIDNEATETPLIRGDFGVNRFTINGNLRVRTTGENDGHVYFPDVYNDFISGSPRDLYINNGGQIGYLVSSIKYKKNINEIDDISWIFDLRPVTYQYKEEQSGEIQYGLIAEEVEQVNESFVSYDQEGNVQTVLYSQLITPLLKALQQQQTDISELKSENQRLREVELKLMEIERKIAIIDEGPE